MTTCALMPARLSKMQYPNPSFPNKANGSTAVIIQMFLSELSHKFLCNWNDSLSGTTSKRSGNRYGGIWSILTQTGGNTLTHRNLLLCVEQHVCQILRSVLMSVQLNDSLISNVTPTLRG